MEQNSPKLTRGLRWKEYLDYLSKADPEVSKMIYAGEARIDNSLDDNGNECFRVFRKNPDSTETLISFSDVDEFNRVNAQFMGGGLFTQVDRPKK